MKDLPERKRNYQAEVHFALGAVIQGVTIAALGNELAAALRNLPFPGAVWVFVTGAQSLLLCIIFWYTFMDHYFFGFRIINLTARIHFLFAAFYLILGLLQLMAIRFLDLPRLWMTFYVLLIATALTSSWLSSHATIIRKKAVRQALEYDPGSRAFLVTFLLSVGLLTAWYVVPTSDSDLFKTIALSVSGAGLVMFTIYSIRAFQRHLDVE
jgi:cytochrome bd-type quinol oxidase subunit 2